MISNLCDAPFVCNLQMSSENLHGHLPPSLHQRYFLPHQKIQSGLSIFDLFRSYVVWKTNQSSIKERVWWMIKVLIKGKLHRLSKRKMKPSSFLQWFHITYDNVNQQWNDIPFLTQKQIRHYVHVYRTKIKQGYLSNSLVLEK